MSKQKKDEQDLKKGSLSDKLLITLTEDEKEFLRKKAFEKRSSMADIVRNYIDEDMK